MFKRITASGLAFISWCLLTQSLSLVIAESVPIRSEYRCAGEWKPFDIAFSNDGTLYSTDVFQSSLFQHQPDCRQLVAPEAIDYFGRGIRGVATDEHGRACFTFVLHISLLSIVRSYQPSLFCVAELSAPVVEPQWLGSDEARGMTAVNGHYLIALWAGLGGLVAVVRDGEVIRLTQLDAWLLPHFIYPVSVDEYFVTVLKVTPTYFDWLERVPAADGGSVLHVRQDTVTELVSGLTYPSGIVGSDDRLFVADYLDGVIWVFSLEGELLGEVSGFEGPMGAALAPSGDICVAEMDAGRITCKPIKEFPSNHLESTRAN